MSDIREAFEALNKYRKAYDEMYQMLGIFLDADEGLEKPDIDEAWAAFNLAPGPVYWKAIEAALSANGGEAVTPVWDNKVLVSNIVRAFWRRIYTYKDRYPAKELPREVPIDLYCAMSTALMHLDNESLNPKHPAPPSVAVPEFLLEMSKQMREQPNRMTAHPFWQVRCNRYLPTLEGCSEHHVEICGDDGVVYRSDRPVSELHEYLIENHEEWCQKWAEENHDDDDWKEAIECYFDLDCDDLPEELRKIPVQEVEEVVSTHLTQAGAEQFIKRKQHDYPKLFTYVESAYWSPQLRELQDWIISLTAAPSPDHSGDAGKVAFVDGVGAQRMTAEECKEGIEYIIHGDNIYWPLSDDDELRLIQAACGNGEFTYPVATPSVPENEVKARALEEYADQLDVVFANAQEAGATDCPAWHAGQFAKDARKQAARLRTAGDEGDV